MAEIVIGRHHIPYRLVRSPAAKNLKLLMTMDEFRVTAPEGTCGAEIRQALAQKHQWIMETYAALQEKYEQAHKIARFRSGAKLPYWGRLAHLRTQLADVETPLVSYKNGFHVAHPNYATSAEHDTAVETALHGYLKQKFASEIQIFARKYSKVLEVVPRSLRVTEMRQRWGSCTDAGAVSLDWRLVYAPKRVAAYVVAHELAHLKVNNHSKKFWSLLRSTYGEHQQEHEWLQKNEYLLGYRKVPIGSRMNVAEDWQR